MFVHQLAQEIAQVGHPFQEYGKYTNDDCKLFEGVHKFGITKLDVIFEEMLLSG